MASVQQHSTGFRAVWRVGGRNSPLIKGKVFPKKSAAAAEARRIERELAARKPLRPGELLSWKAVIDRYKAKLAERGHIAHGYPEKVEKSLSTLVKARDWKTTADVSPSNVGTLNVSQHRYLKAVLRFAQLQNQPVDHRCVRLPAPDRKRKPKAALLTDAEVAALLERAAKYCPDLAAAGHLVATYGHRPESLINITCKDVELDAETPRISMTVKSGDRISHPLTTRTVEILRPLFAGRHPTDRLLLRPDKLPWESGESLSTYWYHQVGENVTSDRPGIYHLKRYAITRLLGQGLDVATIASITGHRTPAVILTYASTNDEQQKAAVAALEKISVYPRCTPMKS